MDEFVDLQAGRAQPLQLMMTGQLVIEGDAQIVMSLFTALSG
jgi:putative sterol carrier protein